MRNCIAVILAFDGHGPVNLSFLFSLFLRDYPESKMIPELKEVVTSYEPEILWSDGEWEATSEYFGSKDFLAWLYNESPVKDYVVTNDR